jgi:ribosomal protein S18 acetylase RimI-like enzyme
MLFDDLRQVVDVHLKSFPGFFLSFLGPRFLTLFYKSLQSDPDGVVLVAYSNSLIEGFVAGVMHQSGFYHRLVKRQKWSFATAAFGAFLRSPSIAPRLIRALRRPVEAVSAPADACLMSIAVRPESAGKGIGKWLVEAFCKELANRGATAVCLTTDRDKNDQVNQFYQRLGFQLSQTFVTPEGRAMNEYFISLAEYK